MKKSVRTFLTAILVCCMVLGLMSPIAVYAQTEETPAASVHSWNLLLADEIAVNFQVDIREVSAGAVMSVTDGYGTTAYSVDQAQKNEAGQYVFTARLAASQLTKPVKLELIDNGEVLLSNTYCAVDYATTVLAGAYPADTKALLSALLHYGAATQNYFAYNTDSLANAGLPAAEAVKLPQWKQSAMVSGSVSGVQCYAANLVLNSRVAVRFYFLAEDLTGVSFGGYTPVEKNGLYYIEIPGINPQNYDEAISVTVSKGSEELTVTYSPMDYILRKNASGSDALKALTAAMYRYHMAAKAYVKAGGDVVTDGNGIVVEQIVIRDGMSSAVVAAGTQLEAGVTELVLSADPMESKAQVELADNETLTSLDVHVAGIAKDNVVPVIVTLDQLAPEALNQGNIALYHVENGETVKMIRVFSMADLDAHNEFYYDIPTGTVSVALCSFSEVAVQSGPAVWQGQSAAPQQMGDVYYIYNADQLRGFSEMVGGMNGQTRESFVGKTVKLMADIDLNDKEEDGKIFYPVGYYNSTESYDKTAGVTVSSGFYTFEGTFDGNGHTVKNFYQNTWEMFGDYNDGYAGTPNHYRDGMGLFGRVYGGTVKNLTVENFSSDGEFTTTGSIAAYADFGAKFENIAIFNCNPRVYNIGNGGIVGCVGWYTKDVTETPVTFTNITVDNSNKISALWGSWDVACGGLVGQYYPTSGQSSAGYPANAGIHMDNCHVAAQIDVNNDVCANYQYYAYRYAGILIGSVRENVTIDGREYPKMDGITAVNCTVHFGDWNDYYYCELVANSLASYTHDHQFSRLTQVASVDVENMQVTSLKGITTAIPAAGRVNYVVVEGSHATEHATCYHFVDGKVHNHADAGEEVVNGNTVLKEDNQHIYLEFNNLVTGYGWGVTSKGVEDMKGVTILDRVVADSVTKFNPVVQEGAWFANGQTVTVDRLFAAADLTEANLTIDYDNVQVFVSPADETSTAGAVYDNSLVDWTKGTITFTGSGYALVTISDYNFCEPTTLKILVTEAAEGIVANMDRSNLKGAYEIEIPDRSVTAVYNEFGEQLTADMVTISGSTVTLSGNAYKKLLGENRIYGDCVLFLETEEDIYAITVAVVTKMIYSYDDLKFIKRYQNENVIDGYFALANDIDATGEEPICLTEYASVINNKENGQVGFNGIFDGRGHTISNLTTKNGGYAKVGGLFGQLLQRSVVRNVAFADISTDGSNSYNYLMVGESCRMMGKFENVVICAKGNVSHAFGFIGCDTSKTNYAARFTMKNVVVSGVDYLAFSIKYPNSLENVITVSNKNVVEGMSYSDEDRAATGKVVRYTSNDALFAAMDSNNTIAQWDDCDISYANDVVYFGGKAIIIGETMNIVEKEAVIGTDNVLTVEGDVTLSVKNVADGVVLSGNTLTLASSVKHGTKVTVVATSVATGVTKEFVLVCYRSYTDAVLGAMDAQVGAESASMDLTGMEANVECLFYGDNTVFEGFTVADSTLTVSKNLLDSMYKQFGLGEHTIYLGADNSVRYAVTLTFATKIISTLADLKDIAAAQQVTVDGYYILAQDIVCDDEHFHLPGASGYSDGQGFVGTFDGRGHVIDGYNGDAYGFFYGTRGAAVIKNVAFTNVTGTCALAKTELHDVTIENVFVSGSAKYLVDGIWVGDNLNNVVFVSDAENACVHRTGGNGVVTMTNVFAVCTKLSGYINTQPALTNVRVFINSADLLAAIGAAGELDKWAESPFSFADGKLYFGDNVVVQ